MKNLSKYFLILMFTAMAFPSAKAAVTCSSIFNHAAANPTQEKIMQLRDHLKQEKKWRIPDDALATVFKHELRLYENNLLKIIGETGEGFSAASLREFYESQFFPEDLIRPRLQMAEGLKPENILMVLGDLTLAETLRLFVGNAPEVISEDSLLGRYLHESGAKLQKRSFAEIGGQKVSPERLVVPVDETSFPIFQKYFSNEQAYTIHGHGNLVFRGNIFSNSTMSNESPMRPLRAQTPLPFVLLKTTEGQRMKRYMEAMKSPGQPANGWDSPVRAPWHFLLSTKGNGASYLSGKGQYRCCTHWNGNIPIGDKGVNKMVLPGPGDQPLEVDVYEPLYGVANGGNIQHDYVKDIWTFPMHEPVSAVLGLADANGRGEFASPGWAIQSLLVSTSLERVPMVFIFTENAKVDMNAELPLNFERPW